MDVASYFRMSENRDMFSGIGSRTMDEVASSSLSKLGHKMKEIEAESGGEGLQGFLTGIKGPVVDSAEDLRSGEVYLISISWAFAQRIVEPGIYVGTNNGKASFKVIDPRNMHVKRDEFEIDPETRGLYTRLAGRSAVYVYELQHDKLSK